MHDHPIGARRGAARGKLDAMSDAKVLLAWSSGKDSAWCLHELRAQGHEVVALITTFNTEADRVAMHAVRRELVRAQARAVRLPLIEVELPAPCPNERYERAMAEGLERARAMFAVTHLAFGDLFLEDIRRYRERVHAGSGLALLFPIWGRSTALLAARMLHAGVEAVVTCVDPRRVDRDLAGRPWDATLLAALPPDADPCGENGEFHTFVTAGPMLAEPVPVEVGAVIEREGYVYADLRPRGR